MSSSRAVSSENPQELVLYHFVMCPFCMMVRRKIDALDAPVELRDTRVDPANRDELIAGGGKPQVPCLRITDQQGHTQWLYESADINRYLDQLYG